MKKLTKNSNLFKNLILKFIFILQNEIKNLIFKKLFFSKLLKYFNDGNFEMCRRLLLSFKNKFRFPILIENLILNKIEWKIFHHSSSSLLSSSIYFNLNDDLNENENIELILNEQEEEERGEVEEDTNGIVNRMFIKNLSASRIGLYLKNKISNNLYLLKNEEDLIRDLTKV